MNKSKFLALVLRHQPDKLDIIITEQGWTLVDRLIEKWNQTQKAGLSYRELQEIVDADNKGRYTIQEIGGCNFIRANQGHSLAHVNLDFSEKEPLNVLYHGTKRQFMNSINKYGLEPKGRHHVHLSCDLQTAQNVAGRRKGESVMLEIRAKEMHDAGYKFFESSNGVWLTDNVPSEYFREIV
jgi:putative RNA 2'-phosphotransferase